MSRDRKQQIERLIDQLNVDRRDAEHRAVMRQREQFIAELEKSLPDVPLNRRGFGVMDPDDDPRA
jgi:hypothetical protein